MTGETGDGGSPIRRLAKLTVNQLVTYGFDDVVAVISALRCELSTLFAKRVR